MRHYKKEGIGDTRAQKENPFCKVMVKRGIPASADCGRTYVNRQNQLKEFASQCHINKCKNAPPQNAARVLVNHVKK